MTIRNWSISAAALLLLSAEVTADEILPPNIAVQNLESGRLFVNSDGLTLYTFKRDIEEPGTSVCVDDCAIIWPPVIAPAERLDYVDWTTIQRDDRSLQWAYRGQPVYTYIKDTHPGSISGEKVSRLWDVLYEPITTPPGISIQASIVGQILVNAFGKTVYTAASNRCNKNCMKAWMPVEAPWMAQIKSTNWAITRRVDGLSQWVYKDQALYTFEGDNRPGDMNGEDEEGIWKVVVLQPAPAVPLWVTFQETDIGPVMANKDRMTLYYLVNNIEQILRETCTAQCIEDNWDPIIAPGGTQPIANWSTERLEDSRLQWTYMGLPVFTFRHDQMPGDIYGDKFGTGSDIRGGWNAILKETLIQNL